MAASAPPPNMSGWVEPQKSSSSGATTGLEIGVSGISLMPSLGGSTGPDRNILSTMDDTVANTQNLSKKLGDSGESVQSHRSATNSPLPNTSSGHGAPPKGLSRPPGLGVAIPSPIGKPGHSHSNSAASATQGLTLTPTSSLDGGSDLYSMGRQSSPFHGDGPSMTSDFTRRNNSKDDNPDLPPGITNLGSFDPDATENDGLLGLQALRDRAQSSPGPVNMSSYSSSPPVRSFQDEQRRPRTVSRDGGRPPSTSRPPLSGGSALSPHTDSGSLQGDRSVGGVSMGFTSSRSREPSPQRGYTYDGGDARAPGVISRPDSRFSQYSADSSDRLDASLRRSTSTDTGREYLQGGYTGNANQNDRGQVSMDQLANKFGSLPSLNSHVNHQRMAPPPAFQPPQQHQVPPGMQRHQRSLSQPGPARGSASPDHYSDEVHRRGSDYGAGVNTHASHRLPPGMENDYGMQGADMRYNTVHGHHNHPMDGGSHMHPRSVSMGHGVSNMNHEGGHAHAQRRSSMHALPSATSGFYPSHQPIPRRESLDFVPGHGRFPDQAPVIASNEEMRMFTNTDGTNGYGRHDRMVSPAHSPLHVNYGSHSRHPSDMGGSAMSSSPMSLGSAGVRGAHGQGHEYYGGQGRGVARRHPSSDEELSHPLLGEHIEVPGDDKGYNVNDGSQSRPRMRSASMGHGHSDQLPSHYGGLEASHHLPTAGSSLPVPRVVYNVKFKRTQRSFVMGPRLNRDLRIGTYVKVEADRGEDLGIVVGKIPSEKYNISGRSSFRGDVGIMPPPSGMAGTGAADLKRIIRLATHDEVSLLSMKREEEEELLKICRAKVRQRGLPMNVVDAEYQFDRHKLTFFFEAEGRIDFRELVRDLFSMYKTRIWMQQLDKSTSATCPTGPNQPQPIVMDYGTPIIAPASEFSDFAAMNGANTAESDAD